MSAQVWINGSLRDSGAARVSPFDHGWTVGNGVFETLIAYGGKTFAFTRHYRRLGESARVMGLAVPEDEVLREACERVLEANNLTAGRARVRITLTGGEAPLGSERGEAAPTVAVAVAPVDPPAASVDVVVVPYTRNPRGALVGVKSTSYGENVIALADARRAGAGEALFTSTDGKLCEGSGSNVFFVQGGILKTPALSSGCLAGVTRGLVLELAKEQGLEVQEGSFSMEEFKDSGEAFLTSTTREVQAIRKVDGDLMAVVEGPMTTTLREAFAKLRDTNPDP